MISDEIFSAKSLLKQNNKKKKKNKNNKNKTKTQNLILILYKNNKIKLTNYAHPPFL